MASLVELSQDDSPPLEQIVDCFCDMQRWQENDPIVVERGNNWVACGGSVVAELVAGVVAGYHERLQFVGGFWG